MSKPNTTATIEDLRDAYLWAFDSFSIVPSDLVDLTSEGRNWNSRYAREILGVLTHAGLLTEEDVNGEEIVWQVANPGTYDNHERDEAEAVINAWLDEQDLASVAKPEALTSSPSTPMNATLPAQGKCYCGCGATLTGKSHYKPGHDARHAGVVGRHVAAEILKGIPRNQAMTHLDALPSAKLVDKATRIAENAVTKGTKTKKAEPAPEGPEVGIVKVGKNEYLANRYSSGAVTYQNAKDEWVEASKTAAKTFQVG